MTRTHRVTSPDGIGIAVFESGPEAGPVIVAVHGFPDDHSVFDGIATELDSRVKVCRYDVRGAGSSDVPRRRSGYQIPHLVDDLLAVLDAVAPDQAVHLLGHDWGSVQLWPALTDPRFANRIASFTSMSGPSLEHAARWLRAAGRHPRLAARQLAKSYYTLLFQVPILPEIAARAGMFDRAIAIANARTRTGQASDPEPSRAPKDQVNGLNLYRANLLGTLSRRQPQWIEVPVQVIAPEGDAYVTAELATAAPAPFVANLRTAVIPGGHWVISDRPDLVAALLCEFIEQIGSSTSTGT